MVPAEAISDLPERRVHAWIRRPEVAGRKVEITDFRLNRLAWCPIPLQSCTKLQGEVERRAVCNGNVARRNQKASIAHDFRLDSPMGESIQLETDGTGAPGICPAPRIVCSKQVFFGVSPGLKYGKKDWIDRVNHNPWGNKPNCSKLCICNADERRIALHQ